MCITLVREYNGVLEVFSSAAFWFLCRVLSLLLSGLLAFSLLRSCAPRLLCALRFLWHAGLCSAIVEVEFLA